MLSTTKYKIIWPLFYCGTWLMIYFLPRHFFHGGGAKPETFLLLILFFIFLPFILYMTLNAYHVQKKTAKGWAYLSVFLILPFLFFVDIEDKAELKTHREETIGIVKKAWMGTKGKSGKEWSVQIGYEVDGIHYQTATLKNPRKNLMQGDTVHVFYSSKTPEICEIFELKYSK